MPPWLDVRVLGANSLPGMTAGSEALASASAKLRWAEDRHGQMQRIFQEFALPSNPNDRPVGIRIRRADRPANLLVATFTIEAEVPETMSLLAADVVHNTRVALDHVLARLKDQFGGDSGRGSFPVCKTADDWNSRVTDAGRASPLRGLQGTAAFELIYDVQPMHGPDPRSDPLVVLNQLDNDDKHRLMNVSFVYPGELQGLELVEILDPQRISSRQNLWSAPQRLEHGTPIARFFTNGAAGPDIVRARHDARIGYAVGDLERGRTEFTAMIARVRGIVSETIALLDATV